MGPPACLGDRGGNPGMPASRGQGGGLGGLGGLGPNLQRQPTNNLAGLQRGMGGLGLGSSGGNPHPPKLVLNLLGLFSRLSISEIQSTCLVCHSVASNYVHKLQEKGNEFA